MPSELRLEAVGKDHGIVDVFLRSNRIFAVRIGFGRANIGSINVVHLRDRYDEVSDY